MKQLCFYTLDVIMLCYFSLPSWPDINALRTAIDCDRFSVIISQSPQVLLPTIEGIVSVFLPLVFFLSSFLSSAYPSVFVFPLPSVTKKRDCGQLGL
jgi:hypothetical protein